MNSHSNLRSVFDSSVKNFLTEILVEMHRYEEKVPPSLLKKIPYDYIATQDVVGYPECPPPCICPPDYTDEACPACIPHYDIHVAEGTKLFLTYFDQGSMQFTTDDGRDVVLHRDWSDSPPCDYKKYFNYPIGIAPIN